MPSAIVVARKLRSEVKSTSVVLPAALGRRISEWEEGSVTADLLAHIKKVPVAPAHVDASTEKADENVDLAKMEVEVREAPLNRNNYVACLQMQQNGSTLIDIMSTVIAWA